MTATQAPTPGPLTSESVKLLVKGDLLRHVRLGAVTLFHVCEDGALTCSVNASTTWTDRADAFAFIGRPDADGWMPWSGGENPVPGQMVECKGRYDALWGATASKDLRWAHIGRPSDIIAFRLAPTAPVEASGSERWPDDVNREEFLNWIEAGKPGPQPSGETRESVARVLRPMISSIASSFTFSERETYVQARVDEILALLSARPLALGGKQGVQERCQRCGGEVQGWLCQSCPAEFRENDDGHLVFDEDATPARAEAQDEGAARYRLVEDDDGKLQLFSGAFNVRIATFSKGVPTSQREDILGLLNRAHPSPTPASDADRVREEVARVEALIEDLTYAAMPTKPDVVTLCGSTASQARDDLRAILAALKTTAAKEGGAK